MAAKTKAFDCVEMKRQAQKKLREEYEARKGEFVSFVEFIRVTANESGLAKAVRAKIAAGKAQST